MKKGFLAVGGIILAVGIAGGLSWYYLRGNSQDQSGQDAVFVSTVSSVTGNDSGITNRYAGVVEPQDTVEVSIDSGKKVKEVKVKTGDEVKQGQLLFEYDLSSIQDSLKQAQLDLDRLKNEAASLTEQIATLEKEKKNASQDSQLSYTIEIETNRMNLKKNEYDQKSKEAQIQKLENATGNTEVRSEIDGVIQKIDTTKMKDSEDESVSDTMSEDVSYSSDSSGENNNAFITILSTGAYRVKGMVNEQNAGEIIPGEPVIVRSRVDEKEIWRGTMGTIDRDNASSSNSNSMAYFGMTDMSDSQTSSSSYPFYVELESSDGLMLGQHVYIEKDNGQEEKKEGIWLSEFYIVDADTDNPYVWAADEDNKLEKREVILGQYDGDLEEYEIADGLTLKDCIAYPTENLKEGMATTRNSMALQNSGMSEETDMVDMETDDFSMDYEGESIDESFMSEELEVIDDPEFSEENIVSEDSADMDEFADFADEELIPVEEDTGNMESAAEDME